MAHHIFFQILFHQLLILIANAYNDLFMCSITVDVSNIKTYLCIKMKQEKVRKFDQKERGKKN